MVPFSKITFTILIYKIWLWFMNLKSTRAILMKISDLILGNFIKQFKPRPVCRTVLKGSVCYLYVHVSKPNLSYGDV